MKFFEDILKNRLKDAVSHEGVDADDLWADIASALPAKEPKRKHWGLGLLLPILFVGGGALWMYTNELNDDITLSNDANIVVYEDEKTTLKKSDVKEEVVASVDANTANLLEKKAIVTGHDVEIKAKKSPSKELTHSGENEEIRETKTPVFAQNQRATSILNDNSLKSTPTVQNETHTALVKGQTQESKATPALFKSTDLLASKAFFIHQNELEKDLTDLALPIKPLPKPIPKEKKLHIALGAYSGINTVKNLFEHTTKGELLKNAYKLRLGYSVGTEIEFTLRNNLSFSTGLEYSKTMTQFNIVQEKDGFTDNPNTAVVDENEVRAKIIRTVKHHNRLDFLTLPLIVSTRKKYGKFDLGIGAGLAWNMVISQGGVSLNAQDEIDDYYLSLGFEPFPYANFLSFHLRPSIQYNISEKLSFHARPEFRYGSHNRNRDEYLNFFGLKHSSIMSRLSLGLSFEL